MTDTLNDIILTGGPIIVAILTLRNQVMIGKLSKKQDEMAEHGRLLEIKIDGRLTQILKLTEETSTAKGVIEGVKQEQEKQNTQS